MLQVVNVRATYTNCTHWDLYLWWFVEIQKNESVFTRDLLKESVQEKHKWFWWSSQFSLAQLLKYVDTSRRILTPISHLYYIALALYTFPFNYTVLHIFNNPWSCYWAWVIAQNFKNSTLFKYCSRCS
jgi:hypothetical protein